MLSPLIKVFCLLFLLFPASSFAAEANTLNLSLLDSFWVIVCAVLVFFMQAGFALVESGMSRAKNSVNVIMKNYADLCLGSVAFCLLGFGFIYGVNQTGWFGSSHFFLTDLSKQDYIMLLFQIMFASTAATIASGALAERTKFIGYIIGATIICALIYPVAASWTWGGYFGGQGWLDKLGFIDYAGSTVVHSVGGWCALAGILVVGPRLGRFSSKGESRDIPGHNLMFVMLGGFILWLGWFGFNGGSGLLVNEDLGLVLVNTHIGAAVSAVTLMVGKTLLRKPVLASQSVNAGLAGLVSVTAGCATMTPLFAAITGAIAAIVFLLGERFITFLKGDDVVSAVAVHGFVGAWGTIAAGLFLKDNLFDLYQVGVQILGVMAYFIWAFSLSLAMYFMIHLFFGLRASSTDERRGLDYTEHYEIAYPEFQNRPLHDKL